MPLGFERGDVRNLVIGHGVEEHLAARVLIAFERIFAVLLNLQSVTRSFDTARFTTSFLGCRRFVSVFVIAAVASWSVPH